MALAELATGIDIFSDCKAFISAGNVIYKRQQTKIAASTLLPERIFIEVSRGTFKQGRVIHAISSGRQSAS
jgi:hypothetical protein